MNTHRIVTVDPKKSQRQGLAEILSLTKDPRYIFKNKAGWEVRTSKSIKGNKLFNIKKYNDDSGEALVAAILYRDELVKRLETTERDPDGFIYPFGKNGIPPEPAPAPEPTPEPEKPETKAKKKRLKRQRTQRNDVELDYSEIPPAPPQPEPEPEPTPVPQIRSFAPWEPEEETIDTTEQVMFIIDGSYLRYSQNSHRIDFMLFRKHFEAMYRQRIEFHYFDSQLSPTDKIGGFFRFLMSAPPHGPKFRVYIYDPEVKDLYCTKCNARNETVRQKSVDVAIAVYAIQQAMANRFDRLLLATGDRDLVPCIDAIQAMGKPVTLVGFPDSMSAELQMIADRTHWLDAADDIFKIL